MYRAWRGQAAFYAVYIEEAHTTDGWQLPANLRDGLLFARPTSQRERAALADACVRDLGLEFPALLDTFDNRTERAYFAWPDRIAVVDVAGRIEYLSAPGPFGFKPAEAERALARAISQAAPRGTPGRSRPA